MGERIRSIKPETRKSQTLARVSRDARLTYIYLWTCCDDNGRFRAAPPLLRAELYPFDDDVTTAMVMAWIAELVAIGRVVLYVIDGVDYGEVVKWDEHQRVVHPGKYQLPARESRESLATSSGERQENDATSARGTHSDLNHDPIDAFATPARESRESLALARGQRDRGPWTVDRGPTTTTPSGVVDAVPASPSVVAAQITTTGVVVDVPTAATMVAWFADGMSAVGLTATAQQKARVGKGAKELLDAGTSVAIIQRAIVEAARRNRVDQIALIAGDYEREERGIDRAPPPPPRATTENPIDKRNREWRERYGYPESDTFGIETARRHEQEAAAAKEARP